jgi:hypothetical protein
LVISAAEDVAPASLPTFAFQAFINLASAGFQAAKSAGEK